MGYTGDRYQVSDEICGQVCRSARKQEAIDLARVHVFDRHEPSFRVRVVDTMAHKHQHRRVWEYWRTADHGDCFRAVTRPELERGG